MICVCGFGFGIKISLASCSDEPELKHECGWEKRFVILRGCLTDFGSGVLTSFLFCEVVLRGMKVFSPLKNDEPRGALEGVL